MGLKIFGALQTLIRRKDAEAAKALANPVEDGKLHLEDAEKNIKEGKINLGRLSGQIEDAEKAFKEACQQVKKYETYANQAAEKGDDKLLATACKKIEEAETSKTTCKEQVGTLKKLYDKTSADIQKWEDKLLKAKSNHRILSARQKTSQIAKNLHSAQSGLGQSGAFSKLDEMEAAVREQEIEAQALMEANESTDSDDEALENAFGSTGDAAIQERMAKFKEKAAAK